MGDLKDRDIIFEFHRIGPAVKVTAVDVSTMTEVSMQGPASTPESVLKQEVVKKLAYVLRKNGKIAE